MSNSKSILAAAAVAALGIIGGVSAADAKPGGGGCCKGGGHGHHWHHRHFLVGPSFYVSSGYGCGGLWNRYLATGLKSYKWRYYACIGE